MALSFFGNTGTAPPQNTFLNGPFGNIFGNQQQPQGNQQTGGSTNTGNQQTGGQTQPPAPTVRNTQTANPTAPNGGWGTGDSYIGGIDHPEIGPHPEVSRWFLPSNYTANLFNLAGVAGNLGTQLGGITPNATNFLNQLFNPQLNQMESTFMAAGGDQQRQALDRTMARLEGQFENTPFHSSLAQVQREALDDTTRNLAREASSLGLQRQQLATGASQFPFEYALNAANVGAQAGERMYNLATNQYAAPYQIPLSTWAQFPISAPVVTTGGGGGGKL